LLKRYNPDYYDDTISQQDLLAPRVDGGVSDHVLNIKEAEALNDKELGKQGVTRACGEEGG
jgi:hypothetical protein